MEKALEFLKGKRVGIAGIGYIGGNLNRYLQPMSSKYGFEILTFDRKNISEIENQEFDYFFNCTGNTGDFRSSIWPTVNSNLFTTEFLMKSIKIKECYVALSSTRIYGFSDDKNILFEENYQFKKMDRHLEVDFVYDGTKMLLESVLWNIKNKVNYRISICRLSNLYGKFSLSDLNDSTYLKLILRAKIEGRQLNVSQNVLSSKGYIFIDDAIRGIILSAILPNTTGIYNLCSGECYSIQDWLKYLRVDSVINSETSNPTYSRISIEKAKTELKFKPEFFLNNIEFNKIFENESGKAV